MKRKKKKENEEKKQNKIEKEIKLNECPQRALPMRCGSANTGLSFSKPVHASKLKNQKKVRKKQNQEALLPQLECPLGPLAGAEQGVIRAAAAPIHDFDD